MMKIRKRSSFTNKVHDWVLPVSPDQMDRWRMGNLIQDVFNNLTAEQREFIQTGVTPDEWAQEFQPRTWIDMAEKTDLVKPGVKIKHRAGNIFTVVENGLNDLGCAVIVKDEYGEEVAIPGPPQPYSGEDDAAGWDEIAPFEVVLEKRDAKLGIVEVKG